MPPKKKRGRTGSRAAPVLGNISNKLSAAEVREHKKRKVLIIEDFKRNVAVCLERMEEEYEREEKSLIESYVISLQQLQPWHHITFAELFEKRKKVVPVTNKTGSTITTENKVPVVVIGGVPDDASVSTTSTVEEFCNNDFLAPLAIVPSRVSGITSLIEKTSYIHQKGRKKKVVVTSAPANGSLTATRSSTRARRPPNNSCMIAPPASTRAQKSKKVVETAAFITPAAQRGIPTSHLFVTPKFDPRVPLPVGTVRRRALPDEVPMSMTGSPLRISPAKPQLEKIFTSLLDTLEQDAPELSKFERQKMQSAMQRFIDNRKSDT